MSAWIRVAARERLDRQSSVGWVTSRDEMKAFFAECDTLAGPEAEPDWKQRFAVIDRSRRHGTTDA